MNTLAICTDREDSIKDYNTAVKWLQVVDDVYPSLVEECRCISVLTDRYLTAQKLNYLNKHFPETKFLREYYSDEAWKVTEAISGVLTRLKNFFTRTIQYIKIFVVVRIGASGQVIKRWAQMCDQKKEEVEQYLKSNDKKEISAKTLCELMMVSTVLYKEFQDMFTKVATMTVDTAVSSDNANQLVEEPGRYQDWLKTLEKVENENPRNKQTMGKAAMSLMDGGWGDAVEIQRLAKATEQAQVVMQDLNKLDLNAKKIISELETSDNTPTAQKTDNDTGKAKVQAEDVFKRRKLEFLKKFSQNFMTKLIGTFSTYCTFAGNQCDQFVKALDKTAAKVTNNANK